MRKISSGLALAGLLSALSLQAVALAAPSLPVTDFEFEEFYTDSNYIPSCVASESCAIFVDSQNGSDEDTNDGSKDKPYKTLTKALDEVTSNDYVIAVAEGTYDGANGEDFPLQVYNDAWFLGGFYEDFEKRDNSRDSHVSVIDLSTGGSNPDAETGFEIGDSAVVDGFEIKDSDLKTGNNGESGGAIQINPGDDPIAITNNTFDSNVAQRGGAIYVDRSASTTPKALIAKNEFKGNESTSIAGGAIYSSGGALIFNNEFRNNVAELEAGAIYANGVTEIFSNLFVGNGGGDSADKGGAIVASDDAKIFNNFFVDNSKTSAIYVTGAVEVVNNTFVKNDGGGVIVGAPGVAIINNLTAYNAGKGIAPLIVSISGWTNENNVTWEDGGISKDTTECDPKFADEDSSDPEKLKLGAGSECIDAGQNYASKGGSALDVDYFGETRNVDGDNDGSFGVDPGAHEIAGDEPTDSTDTTSEPEVTEVSVKGNVNPAIVEFKLNETSTVTVSIEDSSDTEVVVLLDAKEKTSGTIKIEWDQKDESGELVDYDTYTVRVKASNSAGSDEVVKDFELTKPDPNAVVDEDDNSNSSSDDNFDRCAGFVDVLDGADLCDAISHVKSQGYFEGYEDGTFGYDRPISRAEVLKVVFLYADQDLLADDGTTLGFNDVEAGAWYMKYVRTAKESGIVEGYPDGSYRPAQAVARNEFLKIFFVADGRDFGSSVSSAPYLDVPVSNDTAWFIKFVDFVRQHDLMDTDRAGNFQPAAPMTRGDVAEFIYRLEEAGLQS